SAPEPANRSSTRAPRRVSAKRPPSRMLNSASRARSEVGRTSSPSGAVSLAPRCFPATIRTGVPLPVGSAGRIAGGRLRLQAQRSRLAAGRRRARRPLRPGLGVAAVVALGEAELLLQHPALHLLGGARLDVAE